jgi:hypothetical protein
MPSPTPGDLYVKAMAATQRFVDSVHADQWHAPTPNTEWDVKQVANHIIGENLWAGELLRRKTIAEVGSKFDGDVAGADPAAAYRAGIPSLRDRGERCCHRAGGNGGSLPPLIRRLFGR